MFLRLYKFCFSIPLNMDKIFIRIQRSFYRNRVIAQGNNLRCVFLRVVPISRVFSSRRHAVRKIKPDTDFALVEKIGPHPDCNLINIRMACSFHFYLFPLNPKRTFNDAFPKINGLMDSCYIRKSYLGIIRAENPETVSPYVQPVWIRT